MSIAKTLQAAREQRDPQLLVAAIPYAKALGLSFRQDGDSVIGQLDFQQLLIGDIGVGALHGGSTAALLEATAVLSLLWEVEDQELPKTIGFSIAHLRTGRPKTTFASAIVTRHSPTVANVRASAWHDDPSEPIATAHVHLLLVR